MPEAATQKGEREFTLLNVFVKDLSFESPRPVDALVKSVYRPDVELHLDTHSSEVEKEIYEVTLNIVVSAVQKETEETLYLVELSQAGLFSMKGLVESDLLEALNNHCPKVLFSFAREVVSDAIEQGGFPQLLLNPVDFNALYDEYLETRKQQAGGKTM